MISLVAGAQTEEEPFAVPRDPRDPMNRTDRRSTALAALAAAAFAVWAGLPLVLLPFAAGLVCFAVLIARMVNRDTLPLGAAPFRYLDGSHERISDPGA